MSTASHSSPVVGGPSNQPSQVAHPPIIASPAVKQGPQLVYVVENDRISSVITELIVRKNLSSSEVQCYTNGQQAYEGLLAASKAGAAIPDLVVLDLDMPLMDGWEFLEALAKLVLPHPIRVFVLTSSIHPEDQARARRYKNVQGFFTKPLKDAGVGLMQDLLQADWPPRTL